MLTDQHRLLIAAHVDGELSPERQQAAVRRRERSAEARDFLGKLQADSRRVRNLPRQALPSDFAARVLSRLPANDGEVILRLAATRADSMQVLLTRILTAAAVVFIGVGVGLYWVFTTGPEATRPAAKVAERPAAPVLPADPPRVEQAQPVDAG